MSTPTPLAPASRLPESIRHIVRRVRISSLTTMTTSREFKKRASAATRATRTARLRQGSGEVSP